MSHEAYLESVAAYAVGALDGEDRSRLEAHLRAGCAECETALAAHQESLVALVAGMPPVSPPARVRAALLDRLPGGERPAGDRTPSAPWWLSWRLALAGALAVSAVAVVYLGYRVTALERDLARRDGDVAGLRARVEQQRDVIAILSAADTRVVALAGLKPSPEARARMWWLRERGGVFVASGLPATPSGRTYQLWAIAAQTPVSAGIFEVGPEGTAAFRVGAPTAGAPVEMFAVTLEPAGGVPRPTGEMYLAGKL